MKFKEIEITSGGQHIKCKLFIPNSKLDKKVSIVFVHGWSSNDKKYILLSEKLTSKGFTCLTINLRGHGESFLPLNIFSRKDHLQDIKSAYLFMRDKFPNHQIGILGKSYGGYLSTILSEKVKLDFLILVSPALYPDENFDKSTVLLILKNKNIFRQEKGDKSTNMALNAFSRFLKPILFIDAEFDNEVPSITTNLYLSNSINNLLSHLTVKYADHSLSKDVWREDFYLKVEEWLLELYKKNRS